MSDVYATRTDLYRLAVAQATLGGVSTAAQDAALAAASSVADDYLSVRFKLPLQSWGDSLRAAVCKLAAFELMRLRGLDPESVSYDSFRTGHDDAMRWLRDLSNTRPPSIVDSAPTADYPAPRVSTNTPRGW